MQSIQWDGACFFSSFLFFRMMCVMYQIEIGDMFSMSLWTMLVGRGGF